jgi:galactose mutarotase-like enzyme
LGSRISLFNTHNNQRLILEIKSVNTVPWYAITTWTQAPESDFYCIEPWLGLPNAIHHQEGLRWLKPGSLEEAVCVLDARNW